MPLLWLPVGMLVGGAAGNLVDRAREGAVVDFIDPVGWPAFNVADSCIVVGVLVLLYVVERGARRTDVRPDRRTGGRRHPPGRVPGVPRPGSARARPRSA